MTNDEARMTNDEEEGERFVIRHSCFVISLLSPIAEEPAGTGGFGRRHVVFAWTDAGHRGIGLVVLRDTDHTAAPASVAPGRDRDGANKVRHVYCTRRARPRSPVQRLAPTALSCARIIRSGSDQRKMNRATESRRRPAKRGAAGKGSTRG